MAPLTTIRIEHKPYGVVELVLNRPDVRNAFNAEMIAEISQALSELAATIDANALRLLVVRAEGSVFCAGADLNYMKEQSAASPVQNLRDAQTLGQMFFKLACFPVPVICVVQGAAIGGGLGLTVCADYVIASVDAVFATSEVILGIVPGVISPYIVRKIGLSAASPLMLTGRRYTAHEALKFGLVNEVAEMADVPLQPVLDMFLKAGPNAARRTKALLKKASPLPGPDLFQFCAQAIADARVSDEGQAGLAAFFDKKPPPWTLK